MPFSTWEQGLAKTCSISSGVPPGWQICPEKPRPCSGRKQTVRIPEKLPCSYVSTEMVKSQKYARKAGWVSTKPSGPAPIRLHLRIQSLKARQQSPRSSLPCRPNVQLGPHPILQRCQRDITPILPKCDGRRKLAHREYGLRLERRLSTSIVGSTVWIPLLCTGPPDRLVIRRDVASLYRPAQPQTGPDRFPHLRILNRSDTYGLWT